jgi:hypothetical protein
MAAIPQATVPGWCIPDDRIGMNPECLPALQRSTLNNTRPLDVRCNYKVDARTRQSFLYSCSFTPLPLKRLASSRSRQLEYSHGQPSQPTP